MLPRQVSELSEAVIYVDGFDDALRGISSFTWCIGTQAGMDDLLSCRTEASVPNKLVLSSLSPPAALNRTNANGTSQTAVVTARACNLIGQCMAGRSNELSIDGVTPNVSLGYVFDSLALESEASWEDVLVYSCTTRLCSLAPLLDGSEDDAVREALIAPLRLLVVPWSTASGVTIQRPAVTGSEGPLLAASWGGFSDAHSGIGRVELCFKPLKPPSDQTSPDQICHDVAPSGMLVALNAINHLHNQWQVSVTVADRAGNNATITSAGVDILGDAPQPSTLEVVPHESSFDVESGTERGKLLWSLFGVDKPLFTASCTGIQMRWAPFGDAGCNSNTSYEWVLCDAIGNCTAPLLLPWNVNNVSLPGLTLHSGVRYHGELRATGCAGRSNRTVAISRGLICDESDPSVVGTPVFTTVNGDALRVNASAEVDVSWPSVFDEAESLAPARVEICVVYGGSPVDG